MILIKLKKGDETWENVENLPSHDDFWSPVII